MKKAGGSKTSSIKGRRILRLLKLVNLLQAGRSQTTRTLAAECGVSRRTVFRDLELLRQAELGIEFDEQTQSFVMNGRQSLPATSLTAAESLAVLALCHHVGNSHGLPFLDQASSAALKIESNLPAHVRDELSKELRTIELAAQAHNPLGGKSETFAALKRATVARQSVRMRYFDAGKRKEIQTKLNPYRIFFRRRSWYVVGRSSIHRSTRTFNIGRIRELTELDDAFRVPRGFSLKRYLRNAWDMIPGSGQDQRVKIRFSPMVARNVDEVLWHPTQKTRWQTDGTLIYEAKVSGLDEISWWILGYGDQAEVISPKTLKDIVKARLSAAINKYAGPQRKTTKRKSTKKPAKSRNAPKSAAKKKRKMPAPRGGGRKRSPRKK